MAEIHDLIERFGYERTRETARSPNLVDAAASVMLAERDTLGVTYSGFALTSFPHKRLANDQPWERHGHRVRLLIEPGRLPDARGGYQLYGVPYGAQARLIMVYLQTQAIRRDTPEIELGRSMYDWLQRMGLTVGGKTYSRVRDQAMRLSACSLTFSWQNGKRIAFQRDQIIQGGFFIPGEENSLQESLWRDRVVLSDAFFKELREHAVPLSEEALSRINNNSLSIDIYVWLAYRLHALDGRTPLTWKALHHQFGAGYRRQRDFRKRFSEAFELAKAVYPDAQAELSEDGLTLYPSRPPVTPRRVAVP